MIPQQTIVLFIFLIGCKGVYITETDIHPIVGKWTGLEREQKLINSDGITLSTDISTYNKVWAFYMDSTFSVMDVNYFDDSLLTVYWSINDNQLTLTAVGDNKSLITIYDYAINNNILSLTRAMSYDNENLLMTILKFNKTS